MKTKLAIDTNMVLYDGIATIRKIYLFTKYVYNVDIMYSHDRYHHFTLSYDYCSYQQAHQAIKQNYRNIKIISNQEFDQEIKKSF